MLFGVLESFGVSRGGGREEIVGLGDPTKIGENI